MHILTCILILDKMQVYCYPRAMLDTIDLSKKIVTVTDLRRNFGEICANLARIDSLLLTKGGEPFAILKALPIQKMKILKSAAGVWKDTFLDNNEIWKKVLEKKSRKKAIKFC